MARMKQINKKERRASGRVSVADAFPRNVARLSTGQEVKLINISLSGAVLIQSNVVLSPCSNVRLKLKIPGSVINVEGCIQRCRVIDLKQEKVKYEAAIVIDGGLPRELADRLHFLNEENPQPETVSLTKLNPDMMRLMDKAELWVLDSEEA